MASPNSSSFTTSDQYPIDFPLSDPYMNQFMLHDDALLPKLTASASSNSYRKAQLGPSAGLWQTNWSANALCSALGPENSIGDQRATVPFEKSYLCSFQSSPHQQLVGASNASQVLTKDPPAHSPQLIDSPLSLSAIGTLSNMQGKLVDCEMHGGADVTMNGRGSKAASGFCSASNIAEYYQSALHQIELLASALASPTNSLNEESVVIDQMGSQACSPHSFVANYPFDPGFAKQARTPTSFTSFGSYPPLVNAVAMDDLGSACEAPCVSQSVRETSITKLLARAIATPSRWLPSPILDSDERRAASFAMASANAQNVAHNPKLEALPSDGFPNGAQIDERNECNKLEAPSNAPLYASAMPQTRQRLHEIDQGRVFVAKTELIVHSTENFNSAPKDATSMKKRRLEMEARVGKDGCISNAGESKISDPVMDSLAKSQISASHGKGKEKSRAKEERGDNNSSMDTSPRDENATKPAEESRQDFVHVRARRGHATDSHSLAERVRREKISNRMKFLQELVPGCSKITGKVTMLDEIINYVQSLQHQVEFLSMKLAARSISRSDQCEVEKPFMGEGKLLRKVCAAHVGAMSERLWHGGDLQPL